jgi:glycosyltransferase involved in cell wall biosynthesis
VKILLTHPGTQYAPRLASELHRRGALGRFVTGFALSSDSWLGAMERSMPERLRRRWSNRWVQGVPAARLATFPELEWKARRRIKRGEPVERVLADRNEDFQRLVQDRWLAESSHVVGFDTSSWLLAQRSAAAGRPFLLDQSIGHPVAKEKVYRDLRDRYPDWAETVPMKCPTHLGREVSEHALAETIVVPSRFVRRTLVEHGVDPAKISINPFGTDLAFFTPAPRPPAGPVIFLFVGSLSARKGVPTLLRAWAMLRPAGRAELWFAGGGSVPVSDALLPDVKWLGALSRAEIATTLRRAHVLVCPSFFEGLAQVQVEALAAGLPVIGTPSSGSEDIVTSDETGLVIPAGAEDKLAAAMERVLGDDAFRLHLRERVVATRDRLSWSHYGERWRAIVGQCGCGASASENCPPEKPMLEP